jgi:hypothetical protein
MPATADGGFRLDDRSIWELDPGPGAKATFDECVQSVMDQPGFEPQGDRTPEESARAICATKPGGPQEGKAMDGDETDMHVHALPDGTMTGPPVYDAASDLPPETEPPTEPPTGIGAPGGLAPGVEPGKRKAADEMSAVRSALLSDSPASLPPRGLAIWTRMHDSAKRFAAGRYPDSYPRAVAWYAIRRKYRLEDQKGGAGRATVSEAGRKTVNSYPVVAQGGGWAVKMGSSTPAANAAWDRLDTIPVPWQPGATLTVGYSNGGQATITAVFVPRAAVKVQDETGGAAMRWVREHWDILFRLGKSGSIFDQGVQGKRWARFAKFVLTPESATKQIAYGIAYCPWEVDLQGQFATDDEVEAMAHKFMLNNGVAGEMHSRFQLRDGDPPYRIVESYIAPAGHPHFPEGAWIVGAKFADEVWGKVKSRTYKGFSIAGNWGRRVLSFAQAAGG